MGKRRRDAKKTVEDDIEDEPMPEVPASRLPTLAQFIMAEFHRKYGIHKKDATLPRRISDIDDEYLAKAFRIYRHIDDVKVDYKRLALVCHPDKNPNKGEEATECFQRVNKFYTAFMKAYEAMESSYPTDYSDEDDECDHESDFNDYEEYYNS